MKSRPARECRRCRSQIHSTGRSGFPPGFLCIERRCRLDKIVLRFSTGGGDDDDGGGDCNAGDSDGRDDDRSNGDDHSDGDHSGREDREGGETCNDRGALRPGLPSDSTPNWMMANENGSRLLSEYFYFSAEGEKKLRT